MPRKYSELGFIICLMSLLIGVIFTTASAEEPATTAADSAEASSVPEADKDGQRRSQVLDGTDRDAFDSSWKKINDGRSDQEQLRFNVAVMAAVIDELEPENKGEELDVSSMLEALDGKTPEQIDAIARRVLDGELDLDELTLETAQELSEEIGFDVTKGPFLAEIIDLIDAEFGPSEAKNDRSEMGPYMEFSVTVGRLDQMISTYYTHHGELPDNLEALTQGNSPLIEDVPQDPWGNDYIYEIKDETTFSIRSKGADGERGTADDLIINSR